MTMLPIKTQNTPIRIGKIVCVGRNYIGHAREMNSPVPDEPILFLKPSTSIIHDEGTILIPPQTQKVHHEVELGVVIGETCTDVAEKDAFTKVLGYCLTLDITARDIQAEAKAKGLPWSVSKGFDTFEPTSHIIPVSEISDPQDLDLKLSVNGELRQEGSTAGMIFPVAALISYISSIMTLEPGDIIATGTPAGVGEIRDGDVVKAELVGYVKLKINVVKRIRVEEN